MTPSRHAAARSPTVDHSGPTASAATCEVAKGAASGAAIPITERVG